MWGCYSGVKERYVEIPGILQIVGMLNALTNLSHLPENYFGYGTLIYRHQQQW